MSQSTAFTLVFGGHGLGLFGSVDRAALFGLALAFWLAQLVAADAWGRRFGVGPLEALWRGLTKGDWSLGPLESPAR